MLSCLIKKKSLQWVPASTYYIPIHTPTVCTSSTTVTEPRLHLIKNMIVEWDYYCTYRSEVVSVLIWNLLLLLRYQYGLLFVFYTKCNVALALFPPKDTMANSNGRPSFIPIFPTDEGLIMMAVWGIEHSPIEWSKWSKGKRKKEKGRRKKEKGKKHKAKIKKVKQPWTWDQIQFKVKHSSENVDLLGNQRQPMASMNIEMSLGPEMNLCPDVDIWTLRWIAYEFMLWCWLVRICVLMSTHESMRMCSDVNLWKYKDVWHWLEYMTM